MFLREILKHLFVLLTADLAQVFPVLAAVFEKSSDYTAKSPEEMAVYHEDNALHHGHRNHAACHLRDRPERHVVLEHGVQIRHAAGFLRFPELVVKHLVDLPRKAALRTPRR